MPKRHLIASFLKNFTGFSRTTKKVKYLSADKGSIEAILKVEQEHANDSGYLHNGCSGTLIDVVSSVGLMTLDDRMSVSVIISLKYLGGAKVGDEIIISSHTLRTGKKLAFLHAEIRKKETNDLLVQADHVKAYL